MVRRYSTGLYPAAEEFIGNLLVVPARERLTDNCAQLPFSSLLALTAA
jgi:hypothetical protein